ncbi:hypothetical protein AB9F40_33695, partial [Rhizobium leguminosarum]
MIVSFHLLRRSAFVAGDRLRHDMELALSLPLFNVQEVYNWRNFDDETSGTHSAPQRSGQAIRGIQASIDANKSLAHRLNNEGVNIR